MPRQPNHASSIYQDREGRWHGRVSVGRREDGRPDRRHVRGKSRAEVTRKVRALERARDDGLLAIAGERWTVASWLEHWLDNIATPFLKPSTVSGYRVAVYNHLIPAIGQHRLDKLKPEHLERLYAAMLRQCSPKGTLLKPATVHHAHRTARAALNEAVRRGYIARNPVSLARAPSVPQFEVEPYSVLEIRAILAAAAKRRNAARWAIALALGLRQGEALGLKWSDVSWDRGTLSVRRSRVRPKYAHGCGEPSCGKRHAGHCPARVLLVPKTDDPKSVAGKRVIGLPAALLELLAGQRVAQDRERQRAAQLWADEDWIFTDEVGQALNAWRDWRDWKGLLVEAGVRDARLHDARHTAATVLLLLGVQERSMMDIMGWSHGGMAQRYAHMIDPIRKQIADRVDALIFVEDDPTSANPRS